MTYFLYFGVIFLALGIIIAVPFGRYNMLDYTYDDRMEDYFIARMAGTAIAFLGILALLTAQLFYYNGW